MKKIIYKITALLIISILTATNVIATDFPTNFGPHTYKTDAWLESAEARYIYAGWDLNGYKIHRGSTSATYYINHSRTSRLIDCTKEIINFSSRTNMYSNDVYNQIIKEYKPFVNAVIEGADKIKALPENDRYSAKALDIFLESFSNWINITPELTRILK